MTNSPVETVIMRLNKAEIGREYIEKNKKFSLGFKKSLFFLIVSFKDCN